MGLPDQEPTTPRSNTQPDLPASFKKCWPSLRITSSTMKLSYGPTTSPVACEFISGSSRIRIFVSDRQVAGTSSMRSRSFPSTSPSNRLSNFCPFLWYLPRNRGQTLYALIGDQSATWAIVPSKRPFPSQSARWAWPQLGHLTTRRASQCTSTFRTCFCTPAKSMQAEIDATGKIASAETIRKRHLARNDGMLSNTNSLQPGFPFFVQCRQFSVDHTRDSILSFH